MTLSESICFVIVALMGGGLMKLAMDLLVAGKTKDNNSKKGSDISFEKSSAESCKNPFNPNYRIVKAKTVGGEIKYFVEHCYGGKWSTFETGSKNTIDEAIELKNWLIAEDERKANDKILEKEIIE